MPTNKLPPYFEKYFELKFGELNKRFDEMHEIMDRCEVRVSTLENWKSEIMGKLAIVTFFLVLIINMIVDWVRQKLNI